MLDIIVLIVDFPHFWSVESSVISDMSQSKLRKSVKTELKHNFTA